MVQSGYASQIFYILTIFLSKIASLHFEMRLARPSGLGRLNLKRESVKYTMLLIASWIVIALLVLIFQCALPNPWIQNPAKCINQVWKLPNLLY